MELQQIVALSLFAGVYLLFATRLVHRAVAASVGALFLMAWFGLASVVPSIFPDVLLTTSGLMILSGFVKRSGLASWLTLKTAKATHGRPTGILILTGLITFVCGGLLGPVAAVGLVLPVTLLLAVELGLPALPFVVTLSWTALLGGATLLTAHPGNLWVGSALDVDSAAWLVRMAPLSVSALAATLLTSVLVFRKALRVTNERRARILEYDEAKSLGDRPLLVKTLTVLGLVIAGMLVGPCFALSPVVVVLGGAVLLLLWDGPSSVDRSLGDLDGSTLLFYGGLFLVVGALAVSGISSAVVRVVSPQPWGLLWSSALAGVFVDHGAVSGALVPLMQAWAKAGNGGIWPFVALGSTLGAGVGVWGSASNAAALGLAGSGGRKTTWKAFSSYGLLFAFVNLTVVSLAGLFVLR
jgi:Na+/H+ antiporter NhaD/arsenite permease-like protein